MSQEDVKQFFGLFESVKKNVNELNNALTMLEISSLGITTKLLMAEAKKPEAEPPKKYYKVYKYFQYIGDPDASDKKYIKEENAKKRIEELKAEWPDVHYLSILFDDFFDEAGRA